MKTVLGLGPDVVQRILPHRRPFLLVDSVEAYETEPQPTLFASRLVSANEPIFDGHFPGLHLWPGVYTIEGLGQACNLLLIIAGLCEHRAGQGGDPAEVLEALKNLQLGYRLHPGYRADASQDLDRYLGDKRAALARAGLSAAVEVKLTAPVFAGQRLDYRVARARFLDELVRFDVEASVAGKTVAKGVMTSSRAFPMPPGPGEGA